MIVLKIGVGRRLNAERYMTLCVKPDITSIQGCEILSFKQSKDFPNAKSPIISKVTKFSHSDYSFAKQSAFCQAVYPKRTHHVHNAVVWTADLCMQVGDQQIYMRLYQKFLFTQGFFCRDVRADRKY